MTRLEWTEPAVADLGNIQDYIARDSAEYADALIEQLILSVDRLESFPESGRRVPESTDPKIRELLSKAIESFTG
jgi:plasmid stabilization system protein ParE